MESKYTSLWLDTSGETSYPKLEKNIEAEVVVVGGGIAGLMAAYFLLREGKKVVLIEANRIVTGTTGNTTAKVTILHDAKYDFLLHNFGEEKAKLYAKSHSWAIDELERIVTQENIQCGFHRVDGFLYTNDEKTLPKLEKEYEALRQLQIPVRFEKEMMGSPFPIAAALRIEHQALFHPRKFLLSLAQKMTQRGLTIFENTRVKKVTDGEPCVVETDHLKVKAQTVVIATNYPINAKNLLSMKMDQMRSYAFAFKTENEVPDNVYVGLGPDEFTLRTYQEGDDTWVLVGGESHPAGQTQNTDEKYQKLRDQASKYFQIKRMAYQWSAQDAAPLDRVPLTGKMPNQHHVYLTTGYGEWGMTSSILSGQLLADLITGKDSAWKDLYDPGRVNIKASLGKSLEMGKQVVKGFGSYITRHDDDDINTLQKGEGRVVDRNGEKIAISRTQKGQICALSAVCTHLGCVVEWNTSEETWDCPCHGSRFTQQGQVIHGPAVDPLEKKNVKSGKLPNL